MSLLQKSCVLSLILAAAVGCGSPRSSGPTAPPRVVLNSNGTAKRLPPPAPDSRGAITLTYEAFGPSAAAHELLGDEWYSWGACGCAEIDDAFDIRVVVYRGRSLADIQAAYPTTPNVSDYRYVSYDAAIAYLDQQLLDLGTPDPAQDPLLAKLAQQLHKTRANIVARLEK